jgi:hypothetical protein
MDIPAVSPTQWALASPGAQLEPAEYLGELVDLPSSARPGEWCTIVLHDERGEMRWTLVAVEPARTSSLFIERRDARARRRGGPVASGFEPLGGALGRAPSRRLSSSPSGRRLTAQALPLTDGEGGANRLAADSVLRGL